jgi:hypothetical protein
MIQVEVKGTLRFPDGFLTQGDLFKIAERLFVPAMVEGINQRVAIDGGAFPALAPATIKRKGHDRPLIETGKLRSGFLVYPHWKNAVRITIRPDRHEIGKYLQIEGVRSKWGRKFFKFFGINSSMEKAAINYMRERIKEVTEAYRGKG